MYWEFVDVLSKYLDVLDSGISTCIGTFYLYWYLGISTGIGNMYMYIM